MNTSRIILIISLIIVLIVAGKDKPTEIVVEDKLLPVLIMRSDAKVIDYEEIEKTNIKNLLISTRELDSLVKLQLDKLPEK